MLSLCPLSHTRFLCSTPADGYTKKTLDWFCWQSALSFHRRLLIFTQLTFLVATTKCVQVYEKMQHQQHQRQLFHSLHLSHTTCSATNFVSMTIHRTSSKMATVRPIKKKECLNVHIVLLPYYRERVESSRLTKNAHQRMRMRKNETKCTPQ